LDDPVWAATVFTKNRDRLLEAEVAKEILASTREGMDLGRAFHCGRLVAGSLGQPEEFSTQE
jgi:hypothetical protein